MPAPAPATHPDLGDLPKHCQFQHPFFSKLGEIVFRPGEGQRVPMLAMALGDKTATLPLHSLQLELAIEEASPDGRMLALVARALEFVNDLRLGEALPAEVLGGTASWQPDQVHLQLAASRIKLKLAAWLGGGNRDEWRDVNDEVILAMVDSPETRQRLQKAFAAAAQALGLPNAQAVVELVEDAARELAFVEALRSRLLHRVEALSVQIEHRARGLRVDATRHEVMTRVRRLLGTAVTRFQASFEELDAQTGEVLALLRNFNSQRDFIRTHRDRLYGSLRAWEPLLNEWDRAGPGMDAKLWLLVSRTYVFLAPRYMPVQEWRTMAQSSSKPAPKSRQLEW